MSSETYYSPRLSAERATAIIAECNSMISKTMSRREFVDVSKLDIAPVVAKEVQFKGIWQEKDNASFEQRVEQVTNISYVKSNFRGRIIDDSCLLKGRLSAVQERLSRCIPRTAAEQQKKTSLMADLYGEKQDNGATLTKVEAFIEEQSIISDEQQQIIDKYFALLELIGYPQEKFSIEEMRSDIERLYDIFVQQEERKYIRGSIYEVFERHGYHIDDAKWMEEVPCDIKISNLRNAQCRITSTGDDFLLESYGVINHAGAVSAEDRKCMLRDERHICEANLGIEEELEERGIQFTKMYSVEPSEENLVFEQMAVSKGSKASENRLGEGTT